MQTQATSTGTCRGIADGRIAIGDYGTLVVQVNGLWFYVREDDWNPAGGLKSQEFIRLFHMAPPTNVKNNHWGIVGGLSDDIKCCDRNWTRAEVQAAIDQLVSQVVGQGFARPMGTCMDPLGKMIIRRRRWDNRIFKAPVPVQQHMEQKHS